MDLNKLIEIVDEGYPDGLVKACFEDGREDGHGDTLALFLAREIEDTFEKHATDKDQIEEALRVVFNARRELDAVCDVLKAVKFTKTGNAVR
jgi:hypothetical protein